MRIELKFILVFCTFIIFSNSIKCETFTFTGDGPDDLWTSSANWDNYPGTDYAYYDNIRIDPGAVCVINSSTFVHCNLDNFGDITITSTGKLYARDDIYVYNGASLTIENTLYSYDRVFVDFNGVLTNNGTIWAYRDLVTQGDFTISTGSYLITSGDWTNRGDIANDGEIRVHSELTCYDGIITNSSTGSLINYADSKLKGMVNNGEISNYGNLTFESTFTNNNIFTNEGICTVEANTDNFGTITNSEKIINYADFTNKSSSSMTNYDMSRVDNKVGSTMVNEDGSTIVLEQYSVVLFRE